MDDPAGQDDIKPPLATRAVARAASPSKAEQAAPAPVSAKPARPEVEVPAARLKQSHDTSLPAMQVIITAERLLGIDTVIAPSADVRTRIAHGLPLTVLDQLARHIAPTDSASKYRIVPKAMLDRRKRSASRTLTAEEGGRAARLAKAIGFTLEINRDDEKARAFMSRPHPMLTARPPRTSRSPPASAPTPWST